MNRIGGVIVSVLASSVVHHGFIGGVIVSVLASSVVHRGFSHHGVKPKTIKCVCVASPLSSSIKEKEQRLVGSEPG